jgi:uncharacterized phage-associated protein
MASVFDVAAYLIERHGPMTAVKLQKLVYYSQAWSIVWDNKAIFPVRILAWKNGPVVSGLCGTENGQIRVDAIAPGVTRLNDTEHETIDLVSTFYANKGPPSLSDLTYM